MDDEGVFVRGEPIGPFEICPNEIDSKRLEALSDIILRVVKIDTTAGELTVDLINV